MVSFFPFSMKQLPTSEKNERTRYCHDVIECQLRFTILTPDTNSQTCLLLFNRLLSREQAPHFEIWVENYVSYATRYCHDVIECQLRFTILTPDTNSQTCLLLFNRLLSREQAPHFEIWVENYVSYATSNMITL